MKETEQIQDFVNHLRRFAREEHEDRGALADLRSGLVGEPGQAPRMFRHVVPFLGEREGRNDRWFYVVGAMFGVNPKHDSGSSIGKCFKALSDLGSDSIEARFIALLGTHSDDLHSHLYHAASLLKSKDIGLDYYKLLQDLMCWDCANRPVQNKWARDYFKKSNNDKGEDNAEQQQGK